MTRLLRMQLVVVVVVDVVGTAVLAAMLAATAAFDSVIVAANADVVVAEIGIVARATEIPVEKTDGTLSQRCSEVHSCQSSGHP